MSLDSAIAPLRAQPRCELLQTNYHPRMSLIIATLGRTSELERFFEHLCRQEYTNFEVILIDQNEDDRLLSIVSQFVTRFPIRHVRSSRGLSHGRNVGLKYVTGDVVVFPDDDCWYSPQVLAQAALFFSK